MLAMIYRETTHKGKDNTYSFVWKNKKIVLIPQDEKLQESPVSTSKKTILLGLTEVELHKELKG